MNIIKVKDYQEMSRKACEYLINKIEQIDNPVLGLATGSTPEGLYRCLIEKYNEDKVSFQDVTTFNLDEYIGLKKENPQSYYFYMNDKLFRHIDVKPDHVHLPNGVADDLEQECREYEQLISETGFVDVQILGLGINGHIGFNEPGTQFSSRTHVVELDESTRKANSRLFATMEDVPSQAITMGIETIMESKEILLLVSGEQKTDAMLRLFEGEVSEEFPASILKKHPNVTVIADEAALFKCEDKLGVNYK